MSVLVLPEPNGWAVNNRKLWWAAAFIVVAGGYLVLEGIKATMRGHYLTTAVVASWMAPVLLGAIAIAWALVSPTSLRPRVDLTGTSFRGDIRVLALMLISGLVFIPGALLYVIFVPRGQIDLSMSRGFQIFSSVAMALALVIVIRGLISVWRRGGAGFVQLSPSGLENANVKSTAFVAWEDVVGIEDSADTQTRKAVVFVLRDGGHEVIEGLTAYVPGGGLYWMIRHYWRHPDDRAELVDGRALERLREGRFAVDQAQV